MIKKLAILMTTVVMLLGYTQLASAETPMKIYPSEVTKTVQPGETLDLETTVESTVLPIKTESTVVQVTSDDNGKKISFVDNQDQEAIAYFQKYFKVIVPEQLSSEGKVPISVTVNKDVQPGTYTLFVYFKTLLKGENGIDIDRRQPMTIFLTVPGVVETSATVDNFTIQDNKDILFTVKNTSKSLFKVSGRVDFYTTDGKPIGEIPDISNSYRAFREFYPDMTINAKVPVPPTVLSGVEQNTPYKAVLKVTYGNNSIKSEFAGTTPQKQDSPLEVKSNSQSSNSIYNLIQQNKLVLGLSLVIVLLIIVVLVQFLIKRGDRKE